MPCALGMGCTCDRRRKPLCHHWKPGRHHRYSKCAEWLVAGRACTLPFRDKDGNWTCDSCEHALPAGARVEGASPTLGLAKDPNETQEEWRKRYKSAHARKRRKRLRELSVEAARDDGGAN